MSSTVSGLMIAWLLSLVLIGSYVDPMPPTAVPPTAVQLPPSEVPPPPTAAPNPYFTNWQDLYNYGDFSTYAKARAVYEANLPGDPNRLDQDNDGIPCESPQGAP